MSDGSAAEHERRRIAAQARAHADYWVAEYARREQSTGARLAEVRAGFGPLRRALGGLLGAPAVYAVAWRAAAVMRVLRGSRPAATGDDLTVAGERRAAARRRLARRQWQLRVASALRPDWHGLAGTLQRPARDLAGAALQLRRRGRPEPRPAPRSVAAILLGDRLERARAAHVLDDEAEVQVQAGGALASPFVLVTHGLTGAPRGWLEALADRLESDRTLAAVAAVARDAETGAIIDAGWSFDVQAGHVVPVPCAPGRPPAAVGTTCVLVRAAAIGSAPPSGDGSWWGLRRSLEWADSGWNVAVAPVEVDVAPGTRATTPDDIERLCRGWGPKLRREVLTALVSGGGARAFRVHAPDGGLAAACRAAGWELADRSTADVALCCSEDGSLLAEWASTLVTDGPGAVVRRLPPSRQVSPELVRDALLEHMALPSVCIHLGDRDEQAATTSGDGYFAAALSGALRRRGRWTTVRARSQQDHPAGHCADVLLQLRGHGEVAPAPGQCGVLWMVSHPDDVSDGELERHDLVLVASDEHAARLAQRVAVPVHALLQFTDPAVFRPDSRPRPARDVVFVGNWRSVLRRVVWDALGAPGELDLYGRGWQHVAPEHARAEHVPNTELHRLYSGARIVLADHWDDMRRAGFVSNRIYDSLASGAFVICDDFPAVRRLFGDGLVTYTDRDDLHAKIGRYLADDEGRTRIAARGRELVLAHHTVDQRVDELLAVLARHGPRGTCP